MINIWQIEISNNGRDLLLEEPNKVSINVEDSKSLEDFRKELIREKSKQYNDENVDVYLSFVEM